MINNIALCIISILYFISISYISTDATITWREKLEKISKTGKKLKIPDYVEKSRKFSNILTNIFVLQTDHPEELQQLVTQNGFSLIRKIFNDSNYFILHHKAVSTKSVKTAKHILRNVATHPRVKMISQEHLLKRVKRLIRNNYNYNDVNYNYLLSFDSTKRIEEPEYSFNDPLYKDQWYLHNTGQIGSNPENDINVLPVWMAGITGRGVRILVLDDGIFKQNPEVADNYDPNSSADFLEFRIGNHSIPENSHGTYCAAIVAGVANNNHCGVGVAYEAKVGGIRLLDGQITDAKEALALIHALQHVDIYTASWGPTDDGRHVAGPGKLAKIAFVKGVTEGRQGKGVIYVWAAGNGGRYLDNCNLDGYASSPYTLTFGALTAEGYSTYYSEPCATLMASTYVGGLHKPPTEQNFEAAKRKIKVIVPEGNGKCRETFQGTSAAAPMAAGVIALVLQANPELSWRDIQHLIVGTARIPTTGEEGWSINAADKHFHLKIGFGVLDADRMVKAAQKWTNVAPLHVWTSEPFVGKRMIISHETIQLTLSIQKSAMPPFQIVNRLESVIANVDIVHPRCGHLDLFLQSPSGTVSQILSKRPFDNITTSLHMWEFVSLHFWGEDPNGSWNLMIVNNGPYIGFANFISLTLHGTDNWNF